MDGTLVTKAFRLMGHFVEHPTMLSRYLSTNFFGRTPIELRLPWIAFTAIDFLNNWIQSSMSVFEWGAGGSTLFFASRTRNVVSVEHEVNWYNHVHEALCAHGCTNVDLRLLPFATCDVEQFNSSEYLLAVQEEKWDVIMIDGILGYGSGGNYGSYRQICFCLAEKYVLPGGIIVVDDIWMFPELRNINKASAYESFKSVGPCRPGSHLHRNILLLKPVGEKEHA